MNFTFFHSRNVQKKDFRFLNFLFTSSKNVLSEPYTFPVLRIFSFFSLISVFLFAGILRPACAEIQVDAQFPGGNITVDSIDEIKNEIHIRPDLRDTDGDWFYFAFRVRGAEGRHIHFEFEPNSRRLGPLGPAVSSNEGKTWRFLSDKKIPDSSGFTYDFSSEEASVLFAHAIPYTQKNWEAFISEYRGRKELRLETLCKSRTGKRDAELLRISPKNPKARYFLAFTARHHACEVSASHVLEGVIQGLLADTAEGRWLRENTECVIIPFMDKDGVEDGDQGKNRHPHDHNRDYIQELYPTVKAFKQLIKTEPQGKKIVFVDMHSPYIREQEHEQIFSLGPEGDSLKKHWNRFRALLKKNQAGAALAYDGSWDIPAGTGYNQAKTFTGDGTVLSATRWILGEKNVFCAFSMEYGYALCGGGVLTPENARELGRNIAKTWAQCLQEEEIMAQIPVWDLKTSEILPELTLGKIEKTDGGVTLDGTNAFAVPSSAFPDPRNFTIEITAKFGPRKVWESFPLLKKHGEEETGFEYSVSQLPWDHIQLGTRINVNGMTAEGRGIKEPGDVPCTFILAVRDGCPSFYFNEYLGRRCFVQMLPNSEPLWVGKCNGNQNIFHDVTITDLKIYGPDYAYRCPNEPPEEEPRGAILGKGWTLDAPAASDPNRPHILIYGDSISMGYRGALISALQGKVYVEHFCGFVSNTCDTHAYTEAAGNRQYDMIFFNNGLHSLHWTPDKVTDEQIYERTRDIVRSFRAGSPHAKLYWLTTTPHTAKRPAPGQPVEALGELNDVVLRINRIAEQVMRDENVEIIDVYTPLAAHLELAGGDGYHWNGKAYEMIAGAVSAKAEVYLHLNRTPGEETSEISGNRKQNDGK